MPFAVRVLTSIQFLTVVFSTCFVSALLKPLRPSLLFPPLPDVFAARFARHGFWLLLLPICWHLWALFVTNRPSTEYDTEPRSLYFVAYAILGLLVTIGIVGTISALSLRGSYSSALTP